MLGQHVERVAERSDRLDVPAVHAGGDHRRLEQVAPVGGQEHALAHRAHLVAGTPDPLQSVGDRGWRAHLDDEVDGPHVDAQLKGTRRHHAGKTPRLQLRLDLESPVLADRAMVSPGDDRNPVPVVAGAGSGLGHHLRGGV